MSYVPRVSDHLPRLVRIDTNAACDDGVASPAGGHVMSQRQPSTFVAYLRVSTGKQGRSGLGLEAQQAAIAAFMSAGDRLLAPPYVEVESGKNSARPQLRAALDRCRETGATLLIARLDRLARSVRFIAALME